MNRTYIGAKIGVATGRPATTDAAGFAALTYAEDPAGLVSVTEIGVDHATITQTDLTRGFDRQLKGTATGKMVSIVLNRERNLTTGALLPAQAALEAASKLPQGEYSIRVLETDGTTHYITGPIMGWATSAFDGGTPAGFAVQMGMNDFPVHVYPAPAP